jgi:hypothetical protein
LVLNSVTSTPQWIRQPEAAWLCVWCLCAWCLCVSMCSDILGSSGRRAGCRAAEMGGGPGVERRRSLYQLYTRLSFHSMGPSPSPSCLAQTSTIYIYNDNLINDSLRNLTKRTNQRESRTQPSFSTLPLNTI